MIKKGAFVKGHLEDLVGDPDAKEFLTDENGNRLSPEAYDGVVGVAKDSLGRGYDNRLGDREKYGVLSRYAATALRAVATGAYAAGAYTFLTGLGPLGFGLTWLGMRASALADAADSYSYVKGGQITKSDLVPIWAEGIGSKLLAYLPVGTGLIDIYRGRKKFDARAKKNLAPAVEDALSDAKAYFMVEMQKQRRKDLLDREKESGVRILPNETFRDERYLEEAA